MIRQGEIRELSIGGFLLTVVVVSSDRFNRYAPPLVAPIVVRAGLADNPPMTIALHEADPYKGVVDIRDIGSAQAGTLSQEPVAVVIGDTMNRIREAVVNIIED